MSARNEVSELRQLLEKHEEKSIITSDDFESVNLGSDDDPKLVRIGKALSTSEKQAFTSFLKDRVHCFAFSYAGIRLKSGRTQASPKTGILPYPYRITDIRLATNSKNLAR